ncbi:hypothetical protein CCR75_005421 [Bremia lactucae]|uniref:Uncharacterized protein n=1 Tax=Bremia lactucae TaxID=4779 RepID=A0A976FJT0_BRELC|nr:hypothetical protein CCR75_005421 [Bremia lactucae]
MDTVQQNAQAKHYKLVEQHEEKDKGVHTRQIDSKNVAMEDQAAKGQYEKQRSAGRHQTQTYCENRQQGRCSQRRHANDGAKGEQNVDYKRTKDSDDMKQDQWVRKQQKKLAAERGRRALESLMSKQQGQKALEWLVIMDKMERRARGYERVGDMNGAFDIREMGDKKDVERRAEQTFARVFGLEGDSVELSVFSIDTEENQSIGQGCTDRELSEEESSVANCKGFCQGGTNARDDSKEVHSGAIIKGEQFDSTLKTTRLCKDLQRDQLDKKAEQKLKKRVMAQGLANSFDSKDERETREGCLPGNCGHFSCQRQKFGTIKANYNLPGNRDRRGYLDEYLEGTDRENDDYYDASERHHGDEEYIKHLEYQSQEAITRCLSTSRPIQFDNEEKPFSTDLSQLNCQSETDAVEIFSTKLSESDTRDDNCSSARCDSSCGSRQSLVLDSSESVASRSKSLVYRALPARDVDRNCKKGLCDMQDGCRKAKVVRGQEFLANRHSSSQRSSRTDSVETAAHFQDIHEGSLIKPAVQRNAIKHKLSVSSDQSSSIQSSRYRNEVGYDKHYNGLRSHTQCGDAVSRHVQAFVNSPTCRYRSCGSNSFAANRCDSSSAHDDERFSEDEHSVSKSFFAPSQKSLSCLDEVTNASSRLVQQPSIDQRMTSYSSSEELSNDEERDNTRVEVSFLNESDSFINTKARDLYYRQINDLIRRTSLSAVSIAQCSLPLSDGQSSFDGTFDHVHFDHGDDSLVNQLIPIFTRHTLSSSSQTLDDDRQEVEAYDDQLVAHNMSSKQQEAVLLSNKSSLSESLDSQLDARSTTTSMEWRPQAVSVTQSLPFDNKAMERYESDNRSDVSSASGVSSPGFAVQLHLAAGSTQRLKLSHSRRDVSKHAVNQSNMQPNVSNHDQDRNSIVYEHSFASTLSDSIHAPFNSVVNMTSAVESAFPGIHYGINDSSCPSASTPSSQSCVSFFESTSEAEGVDSASEWQSKESFARSNSSMSHSLSDIQCLSRSWENSNDRDATSDGRSDSTSFWDVQEHVVMQDRLMQISFCQLSPQKGPIRRKFQSFETEDERKHDDSSSESDASFSCSAVSSGMDSVVSRRFRVKKAETLVIPVHGRVNRKDTESGVSLAEAFHNRHPKFSHNRRGKMSSC